MKYIQSNYSHKVWLPVGLVRTANEKGWLNSISYFTQIRGLHKKGVIYNFTLRSLSRAINCSPSTLSKHLEIMATNGLISYNNGNLLCTGRAKLLLLFPGAECAIRVINKIADQKTLVKFILIKNKLNTQYKITKLKKDIIKIHHSKRSDPKGTKKLLKAQQKLKLTNTQLETSINDDFILSNRNIGATFNQSQSTGLRLQKKFNKLKLIRSQRNFKIVEPFAIPYREFRERYISNKYQHSNKTGLVFRCLPNKIEIIASRPSRLMNKVVSQ